MMFCMLYIRCLKNQKSYLMNSTRNTANIHRANKNVAKKFYLINEIKFVSHKKETHTVKYIFLLKICLFNIKKIGWLPIIYHVFFIK